MRAQIAFLGGSVALLTAAACGRSDLEGDAMSSEGGAGGAGSQVASSVVTTASATATGTGGAGGSPFCGDGIVSAGEQCDDGNFDDNDACTSICLDAVCGDGLIRALVEECDDGNLDPSDACTTFCLNAACGDGIVWAFVEECDDGNKDNNDGCKNNCTLTNCGNGQIDPGEKCDDGNASNGDACLSSCTPAQCGDGIVWFGVEPCDDGNKSNADICLNTCALATCGDGFVWFGVEQCDDANASNNDACVAVCVAATCGDGFVWAGVEQCDDGNTNPNDGCHNNCMLGACGDGIVDPGEACDDGNPSNTDACVAGCVAAVCGDGFVRAGVEQCDDGNVINGDGCSASCKLPICGDGAVDPGEACDLGAGNTDRPAFLLLQGALAKPVAPIDRVVGASSFYAYASASSHTGYEVLQASRIFLYRDTTTGILSLFMHHGIDFNASGMMQPQGSATFDIVNLPASVVVAVADDTPNEFFKSSPTSAHGDWGFQNNSDGGVLTGLPIPGSWSIDVIPAFTGAINQWAYIDADDTLSSLALAQTVTLKAFNTPSACRVTCTIPACGDGILDGGEVCDDSNTVGGDGCSANCKSLN
jgi:cysteine-rich repeat protein